MPKVTVMPYGKEIEAYHGDNLRTALISNNFDIKSTCGGCASCGQCVIVVKDNYAHLSEISFEEKQILGNVFHITQERLSCQTEILGDVTVDISAHVKVTNLASKTKRRTKVEAENIVTERREKAKEKPQRQGGFKKPKAFSTDK
jgi:uncharacterized 2Fe-2S/4Fe-4S cluster protein (DUF4445 family)